MDNNAMKTCLRGVVKLLESVRSKKAEILENPYKFDDVCDALERRADFLKKMSGRKARKKGFMVCRRICYLKRLQGDLKIVDGVPVGLNGEPVYHPNGQLWTVNETTVELRQQEL